ncbi:hypothetical protein V6Z12_D11G103300 [Gossypium hirsutum]
MNIVLHHLQEETIPGAFMDDGTAVLVERMIETVIPNLIGTLIMEDAMVINPGGLGKVLIMMGFWGVVLFLDRLDIWQELLVQRFELMTNTILIEVMSHTIPLALIRLYLIQGGKLTTHIMMKHLVPLSSLVKIEQKRKEREELPLSHGGRNNIKLSRRRRLILNGVKMTSIFLNC